MYTAVEKAIRTGLLANTSLSTAVGGRVFIQYVPLDTAYPHVLISLMAGGDENETQKGSGDVQYLVKVMDMNAQAAKNVAALIHTALNGQTLTVDAPYTIFWIRRATPVRMTETIERQQYHHMGGVYRIRISE